jgi:hypothetical protein
MDNNKRYIEICPLGKKIETWLGDAAVLKNTSVELVGMFCSNCGRLCDCDPSMAPLLNNRVAITTNEIQEA